MGRRSAMDRLSLIDMSSEDDSLLPVSCQDAGHPNLPQILFPPSTSPNSDKNDLILPFHLHNDSINMEEPKLLCSSIPEESQISEEQVQHCNLEQKPVPPVFRRSKTVGHANLRKSLAWDKAFLTGEGVLDLDELPVPPQRTNRLPKLPSLEPSIFDGNSLPGSFNSLPNPSKLAYGSQGRLSVMNKCTPVALDDTALPSKGIDVLNTMRLDEENAGTRPVVANSSEQCSGPFVRPEEAALDASALSGSKIEQKKLSMETSVSALPRAIISKPIPIKTVIEAAVQKGTRLRLPSSFIRKSEEKDSNRSPKVRINEYEDACLRKEASTSSTLTSKASAVSKKVKESLVNVLPGISKSAMHEKSKASQEYSNHTAEQKNSVHAESLSTVPSAALLTTKHMPKREVAFTTRKHDSNAIKSEVLPLEDINHKKPSSSGIVSSSAIAPSHPVSMKVACPSTVASDTQNKNCSVSSSSKHGSNAGYQCTKIHKRANKNPEKLQSVVDSTGSNSAGNFPGSSWKSKPSGLRMPSPKLGFFDSARVLTGVQPLTLSERADSSGAERALELEKNGQLQPCSDTASISNRGLKHSLNLKAHGLPFSKPSQRFSQKRAADTQGRAASSSIPSAPHLRLSESASFPTVTSSASSQISSSGQHTSPSPFSTEKKVITSEMLGLDCSTCDRGNVFREQTTAANVEPVYQVEGLNLKEMTSLEKIQSSIEVINTDELSDSVVTNNEDETQCLPMVLESSAAHTSVDCVTVEKPSVPILSNYSMLHTNLDILLSPPVEAHSLDCDTNRLIVINDLERVDSISERPTACPLFSEQITDDGIPSVGCSNDGSDSLIILDNMCSELAEQDGILAQISQEEQEKKNLLPAINHGAVHCLDSEDERCKKMDKSATFCSSMERLYENEEKEDNLDDSPSHSLNRPVLKASAEELHMSFEPTIPSNLDIDTLQIAGTDKACHYSQQCDQLRSRSPLSPNIQLTADSPQDRTLQKCVKKLVGKFTTLDPLKNDLLDDPKIYDGADNGNPLCDRSPIERVNFESLSRECAFKENVFTPETIDLEDLVKSRGPVLHSPPNKTSPTPGSWSPVRRKMQQLGPFDCTKHLNLSMHRSEQ